MTSTLAAFSDTLLHDHRTLPTFDVEILQPIRHCATCQAEVTHDPTAGPKDTGGWVHCSPNTPNHRSINPRFWCGFCNNDVDVRYVQSSSQDKVECGRCGGTYSYR